MGATSKTAVKVRVSTHRGIEEEDRDEDEEGARTSDENDSASSNEREDEDDEDKPRPQRVTFANDIQTVPIEQKDLTSSLKENRNADRLKGKAVTKQLVCPIIIP